MTYVIVALAIVYLAPAAALYGFLRRGALHGCGWSDLVAALQWPRHPTIAMFAIVFLFAGRDAGDR